MGNSNELVRINKAIASRGICSRRKAEQLVNENKVYIHGKLVKDLSLKIPRNSIIEIDGKLYPPRDHLIYLMMNKPVKVICSIHDPQGRKTVMDLIPERYKIFRPFPVGRLDFYSEGLLLLTNDGDFAQQLLHPRYNKIKKYEVLIRGNVKESILNDMRQGMVINQELKYAPIVVSPKKLANENTLLHMELRQGLNRQIRKMCAKYNLHILKLKRIAFGPFILNNLKSGSVEEINQELIQHIKKT